MEKQISIFGAKIKKINLDTDIYFKIVDYGRDYCELDKYGNISLVNRKRNKIPIWRIVRNCWNKYLFCKYKDNNRTNLTRNNILLCLKK